MNNETILKGKRGMNAVEQQVFNELKNIAVAPSPDTPPRRVVARKVSLEPEATA